MPLLFTNFVNVPEAGEKLIQNVLIEHLAAGEQAAKRLVDGERRSRSQWTSTANIWFHHPIINCCTQVYSPAFSFFLSSLNSSPSPSKVFPYLTVIHRCVQQLWLYAGRRLWFLFMLKNKYKVVPVCIYYDNINNISGLTLQTCRHLSAYSITFLSGLQFAADICRPPHESQLWLCTTVNCDVPSWITAFCNMCASITATTWWCRLLLSGYQCC